MTSALAAGCTDIRPCLTVEEARELAEAPGVGQVLVGGERGGARIEGFDLGNSPLEYTAAVCRGQTLVMTTSNGTRALLRAAEADRVLVAGFVNLERLREGSRPVHLVWAGTDGAVTLEERSMIPNIGDVASGLVTLCHARGNRDSSSVSPTPAPSPLPLRSRISRRAPGSCGHARPGDAP